MLDSCARGSLPSSSQVSIPISTASSPRTSNGVNWRLQQRVLQKRGRGGAAGRAAVMRFRKPPCHPEVGRKRGAWHAWGCLHAAHTERLKASLAGVVSRRSRKHTVRCQAQRLPLPSPGGRWAALAGPAPRLAVCTAGGTGAQPRAEIAFTGILCFTDGETEAGTGWPRSGTWPPNPPGPDC